MKLNDYYSNEANDNLPLEIKMMNEENFIFHQILLEEFDADLVKECGIYADIQLVKKHRHSVQIELQQARRTKSPRFTKTAITKVEKTLAQTPAFTQRSVRLQKRLTRLRETLEQREQAHANVPLLTQLMATHTKQINALMAKLTLPYLRGEPTRRSSYHEIPEHKIALHYLLTPDRKNLVSARGLRPVRQSTTSIMIDGTRIPTRYVLRVLNASPHARIYLEGSSYAKDELY